MMHSVIHRCSAHVSAISSRKPEVVWEASSHVIMASFKELCLDARILCGVATSANLIFDLAVTAPR
jgi:hypothetical protein